MHSLRALALAVLGAASATAQLAPTGAQSSYVAPPGFPTSVFSSYYSKVVPTQEPQPAIFDPVLNRTFPLNLTDFDTIPSAANDPVYLPTPTKNLTLDQQQQVIASAVAKIKIILNDTSYASNCTRCQAALAVGKTAAQQAPSLVSDAMVDLCNSTKFATAAACKESYSLGTYGAIWTQVLAFADVTGYDGQFICYQLSTTFCPRPSTLPLDTCDSFPELSKPKPCHPKIHKPSGKRVKVLHMSDFHIDPRYSAGSEANCTSGLCCRNNNRNTALPVGQVSLASPLYGYYTCDTPYDLGITALESVATLTGTGTTKANFAWTIYTGDIVAHDPQSQLSRDYALYSEASVYTMFANYIGGPIFTALGNHDSDPDNINAPNSLPGPLGQQQSWNYDHVSAWWKNEGWITQKQADQARTHYGGYSIKTDYGLRVITINTDFWYRTNFLNYINMTNPDVSGTFRFLVDELQKAEDCGERVWIVGHVISGWDGTNPLPNPTNLFYQIIDRYSPHVIANVFFGHTHEDQAMIYYANNGTVRDAANALTTGWIGPSIVPLTNLNSGYRMYEVDTGDFSIYEAYTFYTNISANIALNGSSSVGPTWKLEYNTRNTYGAAANWPTNAPLNATFWHRVTEAMERNNTLVSAFNSYQGKLSQKSPNCTCTGCISAKICYIRSGSVALAQDCVKGFGSVQSPYTGTC